MELFISFEDTVGDTERFSFFFWDEHTNCVCSSQVFYIISSNEWNNLQYYKQANLFVDNIKFKIYRFSAKKKINRIIRTSLFWLLENLRSFLWKEVYY